MPEEFFSAKYLYGDYTKLNKYLINKYSLIIPKYNVKYKNIVQEVKNRDMEKVLLNLQHYIVEDESSLTVFSKESLERFVKKQAQEFSKKYII